jgi:PTH2 family peptidyl-tRNA hydrolase
LVAGVTGYFLGQAKSLGLFGGSPVSEPRRENGVKAESSDESSDDEDADELSSDFPGHNEECKLVLVVRTDLGMTKGEKSSSAASWHIS